MLGQFVVSTEIINYIALVVFLTSISKMGTHHYCALLFCVIIMQ